MDTRRRTVVKAALWAVLGWIVMALVGLAFTGSVALGGAMAAANTVLGMAAYILYERAWAQIDWGRA